MAIDNNPPITESLLRENGILKETIKLLSAQLDDILSSVNEVIWSRRVEDFSLASINNACLKIFGYTPEEMLAGGGIVFDHIHPDDKPALEDQIKHVIRDGHGELEYRIFHKDGSVKYIYSQATLKRDDAGNPIIFNGSSIDLSEHKMQMQRIQDQNDLLAEIAWMQSHQVRGPVANILGLAQLFNEKSPSDPVNEETIIAIKEAAIELDNIIAQIMNKVSIVSNK